MCVCMERVCGLRWTESCPKLHKIFTNKQVPDYIFTMHMLHVLNYVAINIIEIYQNQGGPC